MKDYSLAQLTLYYLTMKIDGIVDKNEIEMIHSLMEEHKLTRAYVDSVVAILDKYKDKNSLKIAIDDMNKFTLEEKKKTVEGMTKIAKSDGNFDRNEINFIIKVKEMLNIK